MNLIEIERKLWIKTRMNSKQGEGGERETEIEIES